MTRRLLVVGVCLLGLSKLWADDVDNLFVDPPKDTTADLSQKPNITSIDVSPTHLTGSVVGDVGALSGEGKTSGFYALTVTGVLDSRPNKWFGFHGVVSTTAAGLTFTGLTIGDIYFDYNYNDLALIRAGRQTITWGQGRIFDTGNFVSESVYSTTFKIDTPLFGQNLTLLAMGDPSYIADVTAPSPREFIYCGQYLANFGPLGWGLAARDHPGRVDQNLQDQALSSFVKTSLAGFDLFAEGIWTPLDLQYLAGFYWEGGDWDWRIQGEITDSDWGAGIKATIGGYTIGSQWKQSRTDQSGSLTTGIETNIGDGLTLALGVPWIYGSPNSTYVLSNPDPGKRLLATGVQLNLSESF